MNFSVKNHKHYALILYKQIHHHNGMKHAISTVLLLFLSMATIAQESFINKYKTDNSPYNMCSCTYLPESMIAGMKSELESKYPTEFVKGLRTLTIIENWGHTYNESSTLRNQMINDCKTLNSLTKRGKKVYNVIYSKKGSSQEFNDPNSGYNIIYLGKIDEQKTKQLQKKQPNMHVYSEIVCFIFKIILNNKNSEKVNDRIFLFEGEFTDSMLIGFNKLSMNTPGHFHYFDMLHPTNRLDTEKNIARWPWETFRE